MTEFRDSFFEQLAADRPLAKDHRLKNLRLAQNRRLLEAGLVQNVFSIVQSGLSYESDDFFLVRQSTVSDLDSTGEISPELEDVLDVYAGVIRPDSEVLKLQQLKPLSDLAEFNPVVGQIQVGVRTADDHVSILPIRGLPIGDLLMIDSLLHQLSYDYMSQKIDVDPATLAKPEPARFIRQGIPLI